MERAVKNCIDDKFSESNLNTLLWRISFGFSDTSNILFFNCSKDELLCKKQQLILEYNNLGISKSHIKSQFNINDEELKNIIENSIKEKKDNLIKEIYFLQEKELFLNKKMDFIDEKIKLLDDKLNIIDDKLKNNEIKRLFFNNNKKRKLNI